MLYFLQVLSEGKGRNRREVRGIFDRLYVSGSVQNVGSFFSYSHDVVHSLLGSDGGWYWDLMESYKQSGVGFSVVLSGMNVETLGVARSGMVADHFGSLSGLLTVLDGSEEDAVTAFESISGIGRPTAEILVTGLLGRQRSLESLSEVVNVV